MFYKDKYKEVCEQQKKQLDEAISCAQKWKELSEQISERYEQVIKKDLPEATALIQRLQAKNNELILEVVMYKSMMRR
jgi:hypothetical protein